MLRCLLGLLDSRTLRLGGANRRLVMNKRKSQGLQAQADFGCRHRPFASTRKLAHYQWSDRWSAHCILRREFSQCGNDSRDVFITLPLVLIFGIELQSCEIPDIKTASLGNQAPDMLVTDESKLDTQTGHSKDGYVDTLGMPDCCSLQ